MATVYIVSSPFVGPTSSKALYRAIGTFMGAAAAVVFVPMFVQSPYLLVVVIALWTGTLLFLSMHLRTANNYALMLAGYTLPLIALPVVDNPLAVWDVAEARTEEIFLGIAVAAVVGAMFWPRRLMPVFDGSVAKWFADAQVYSQRFLSRNVAARRSQRLARRHGRHLQHLGIDDRPVAPRRRAAADGAQHQGTARADDPPAAGGGCARRCALRHRTPCAGVLETLTPLLEATDQWLQSTTEVGPVGALARPA